MAHVSKSVPGRAAASVDAAALAVAAVVTVAGLAAYLTWPARRSRAMADKHQSLAGYLRDHLAGADAAIDVVRRLAATHGSSDDGRLFRRLAQEFEQDRAAVRSLLSLLGVSAWSPKRVAGRVSAVLLGLVAGGQPGHLSLLRTLEALSIGIQGKRCMWRALQTLETTRSMDQIHPVDLEARALRQWEAVEERRQILAAMTFPMLGSDTDVRAV